MAQKLSKPLMFGVIFSILFVAMLSYHTGYSKGTTDTLITVAELAPVMLDLDLTDRAKMAILSNPQIVFQALTPESLDKLYSDLNRSAEAKGGIGAAWNMNLES